MHQPLVPTSVFTLHFDVPEHGLRLDDFLESALSTKIILNDVGKNVFQQKVQFEVLMLPPTDGGLIKKVGVVITAVGGTVWGFLHSDIGIAYVKGLSGHEPVYWSEVLGNKTAEALNNLGDHEQKQLAGKIMTECTQGVFTKTKSELESSGITSDVFGPALMARNDFYETCINNPRIAGIGFDSSHNFPIKRNTFANRVIPINDKNDDVEWVIQIVSLKVESPTWNPEGRLWVGQFKDSDNVSKTATFNIEDDAFWLSVLNGGLKRVKVGDSVVVQWARQKKRGPIHARALKVLEYNAQKISEPLNDVQIQQIMDKLKFKVDVPDDSQPSFL